MDVKQNGLNLDSDIRLRTRTGRGLTQRIFPAGGTWASICRRSRSSRFASALRRFTPTIRRTGSPEPTMSDSQGETAEIAPMIGCDGWAHPIAPIQCRIAAESCRVQLSLPVQMSSGCCTFRVSDSSAVAAAS